ncbi:MAG: hypothetical protein AAGD25_25970 [Cyanobacteria bacterium P01_F01_bin.150]
MQYPGIILAIGLALVHAFVAKLNISKYIPEFRWLSFAGGVSIGYVFLEVFPELSHAQEELEHSAIPFIAYLENHVYLLAMLGLLFFYGLDVLAFKSKSRSQKNHTEDKSDALIFGSRIASFTILNAIFGYLLQDLGVHSLWVCFLFFLAVSLHFFIIDHHLREHHQNSYDKQVRWILTAAIMVGAIAGQAIHLNEAALSIIWSFLAGSIIFNILKHELPDEKKSCFGSFTTGAGIYTLLLLLT